MHCSECPEYQPDTRATNFPRDRCGFTGVDVTPLPPESKAFMMCPANIAILQRQVKRNTVDKPARFAGHMKRVAEASLRAASKQEKLYNLLELYEPHEQEVLKELAVDLAISDDLAIQRKRRKVELVRKRRAKRRDPAPAHRQVSASWGMGRSERLGDVR